MNMAEFRGFYELNSCTSCGGTGYRAYASTATWRGGAGGMAITNDICDRCWGSGDSTNTWCDLWKISNQLAEKDAQISKDGRALKEAHAELSRLYAKIERLEATICTTLKHAHDTGHCDKYDDKPCPVCAVCEMLEPALRVQGDRT